MVRFDIRNATDSICCRERVSYAGHISDRLVEELESNCSTTGPILTFKISSTLWSAPHLLLLSIRSPSRPEVASLSLTSLLG